MVPQLLLAAMQCSVQMHAGQIRVTQGQMQLRALEMQLAHQNERADRQAALARDILQALIGQRMDAARTGFTAVIALYGEQARHYMEQQARLQEASFAITDAIQNTRIMARVSEIDLQLSAIRSEASLLYQELNRTLMLIGEAAPFLSTQDGRALLLT